MSVRGGEGAGEGEEASDSDALPTSAGGREEAKRVEGLQTQAVCDRLSGRWES